MAAHTHTYVYRAVDSAGSMHAGSLSSLSRAAALGALAKEGLIPIELNEGREAAAARTRAFRLGLVWGRGKQASPRELLALTQSLAALLNAGLTIDRALQIGTALAESAIARAMGENLLAAIRSGKTLSDAFAASRQRLPPYYTAMIAAGEVGGSLPDTLNRLADLMRRQLEVRERVRSALIYPALLAGVVLFTLVVLLAFVLPRFEQLFAESDAALPLSTRAVLGVGRFVADFWWILLGFAVTLSSTAVIWMRSPAGRVSLDRMLLTSRFAFGLPAALDTARFLRTLSALCRNGIPLAAALREARGTVGNRCLVDALGSVSLAVQGGEPFSGALARAAVFPAVAVQLARVGEETGHLDGMLLSAAEVLEEEGQRRLERLLTLVVPLLTVAMGLLVAGLIGSVLIGLLSINDLAF